MKFVVRIAEKNIEIQCKYPKTYEMCSNYLLESDSIDVYVEVSDTDIAYEKERSEMQNLREGKPVQNYSPDYLETLAVYRKIASEMLRFNTLLIHGSVVAIGDKAVIFTGASGIGKTTHSKLWLETIPGTYILNGDKPLIRVEDRNVLVFGTPWAGKENLQVNRRAELCAVVFIERGTQNQIQEADPLYEFRNLLKQIFIPEDASGVQKILELSGVICEKLPFYRLCCNMETEAAQVSWNVLKKVLK